MCCSAHISITWDTARREQDEVGEPMRAANAARQRRRLSLPQAKSCSDRRRRVARVAAVARVVDAATIPLRRLHLQLPRVLLLSAVLSVTAPMTTAPYPHPSLVLRKRLRQGRSQSDRSSSSGMPAKRPACTGLATTPIFRSYRTKKFRRSSIWIWLVV